MRTVRGRRPIVVTLTVAALMLAAAGPAGAAGDTRGRGTDQRAATAALMAAMQRDLHLTEAQVNQLVIDQANAGKLNAELPAKLGSDFAGSWFDPQSGRLVVAVTGSERAAMAKAAGADAVMVKRNLQTLNTIKSELDTLARQDRAKVAAAIAWSVDVQHNQILVTVRKGQAAALGGWLAKQGDAVRVEESDIVPTLTGDFLDGGDPYNGCSVGFNVLRNGVGHFLTAGHCGVAGNIAQQNGVNIGPFLESWFPTYDDALVRNDNPGYWWQGPWVYAYTADPNVVYNINGYARSPVGVSVCKSGRTTGLTCGRITVTGETVNTTGGTVFGMTRHSACVEHGDSGGANFSFNGNGNFAEGVTSAAQLVNDTLCLEKLGWPFESVSWFYPVADSIAFYGVTLWTV